MTYKERISETMFSLFAIEKSETVFSFFEKEPPFIVSWSHYLDNIEENWLKKHMTGKKKTFMEQLHLRNQCKCQ